MALSDPFLNLIRATYDNLTDGNPWQSINVAFGIVTKGACATSWRCYVVKSERVILLGPTPLSRNQASSHVPLRLPIRWTGSLLPRRAANRAL